MRIRHIPGRYAVCRLDTDAAVPEKPAGASLWSATRTKDELSLVCPEEYAPAGARVEDGFAALMVEGPLDFSLTGVLASLAEPLARAGVSIFCLSTFDTDWLLVPAARLETARDALRGAGFDTV
ncbi:ACT domain-containing protein [Desulfohalovibrio reitneri]|uniref:ACT domain-containing protein n=1 Tax=Desulfohalovibrio reitneri TaxID=1307759 RepID=UPI0004A6E865|nr:ACT domain-containing protein [Desulfohalovibrio reitneri]